jgi:hypothetical protein
LSIVKVAVSAEALRNPTADARIEKLRYGILETLLKDLVHNGVIAVDSQGLIVEQMYKNARDWPGSYRTRLMELLKRLRESSRFFKTHGGYLESARCVLDGCRHSTRIAIGTKLSALLLADDCTTCTALALSTSEIVALSDYPSSALASHLQSCRAFRLQSGQWSKSEFEERFLRPLLSTAKHVKIFDRYFGRTIYSRESDSVSLRPSYTESLEWFFDIFVQECSKRNGVFEIYCGFEPDGKRPEILRSVKKHFEEWRLELNRKFNYPLKVYIKSEKPGAQMPHARYLITDQVGVLVEAGFDLFLPDGEMRARNLRPNIDARPIRDVEISICADRHKLETEVRRLPDL